MNLETFQQEIRAEAERLRREFQIAEENDGRDFNAREDGRDRSLLAPLRLDELHFTPAPVTDARGTYRYRDLAAFDDREFIRVAYRALLRHSPDPRGEESYLQRLRNGTHKAEILARLRWSHEGRTQKVHVRGMIGPLALAALAYVPLLGALVQWCVAIVTLPSALYVLRFRQEKLRAHLNRSLERLERKTNEQSARINTLLSENTTD